MAQTLRWLWCVVLLVVSCGLRAETVDGLPARPDAHVEDYAGILSPQTTSNIEDLLTQLNLKAHARIEVVTVKSLDPDKSGSQPSIEEFATALEDKWKVGEKGTDRGLLLIISLNPRKYRFEVGYGLEGILNDAKVGDIGREMQPYLHTGNYDQAISIAVGELAQDIAADANVTLDTSRVPQNHVYDRQPQAHIHISPIPALLFGLVILFVLGALIRSGHAGLLFFFLLNMLGGGRGGGRGGGDWGGGGGGDWGGGGGGDSGVGFGGGSGGGGASGDF